MKNSLSHDLEIWLITIQPFVSIEEPQAWVDQFVKWYNEEHLHSSIRFVTPNDRHYGREVQILEKRQRVYQEARNSFPTRWSGRTRNWEPVQQVILNPEKTLETKNLNLNQAA